MGDKDWRIPLLKALKPELKVRRRHSLYKSCKPPYKAGEYRLVSGYALGTEKNKRHVKAKYIVLLLCAKSIPDSSY